MKLNDVIVYFHYYTCIKHHLKQFVFKQRNIFQSIETCQNVSICLYSKNVPIYFMPINDICVWHCSNSPVYYPTIVLVLLRTAVARRIDGGGYGRIDGAQMSWYHDDHATSFWLNPSCDAHTSQTHWC